MDIKDLRSKNPEELRRLAQELRTHIREGRFHLAMQQSAKTKAYRQAKKDLARLETVLNERASS